MTNVKGTTDKFLNITVFLLIIVALFPTIQAAIINLSGLSGFALASLFASGGIIFVLISVWVFKAVHNELGGTKRK